MKSHNRGMTDKEISRLKLRAKHHELINEYGKAPCCIWNESHKQGGHGYEWANVTGYYSGNVEDYLPMCIPCHRSFDTTEYQREMTRQRRLGKPAPNRVSIAQYTTTGKLVAVHDSMTAAAASVDTVVSSIANHLAGKTKTAKGYTWRYNNA